MVVYSLILIAAALMAPVGTGQITASRDLSDSDVGEIEKTFSDYNQALVEKKYEELTHYIHVPFVVVDSTPRIVTDIAAVIAGLRSNRDSLDQKGYATSLPGQAYISVLNSDRVLLNRIIRHYKRDGSLLETRANFYLMSKASGTWMISGIIQQDAAYRGKIYPKAQTSATTAIEPFEGRWELDTAQTKFTQGSAPRAQTLVIQRQDSDFLYNVTGTNSNGSLTVVKYVVPIAGGDGKFLEGPYDGVHHKRIDANTREAVYLRAGKEVLSFRGVVAKNSRSLTITVKGTGPGAEPIAGVSVYKKQKH